MTQTDLGTAIERAFADHASFLETQQRYVLETFEFPDDGPTAPGAADAIVNYLRMAA